MTHWQQTAAAQQVQKNSIGWYDRAGIWTSVACVIHCLLMPVVLSMSIVGAHFLPSEEGVHRSLALLIACLGALALVKGFRTHGKRRILVLMAIGLACIFFAAFRGDRLPSHWHEVAITLLGSIFMISAHRLNHTFCKDCACALP